MSSTPSPSASRVNASAARVREHRAGLREQGLRPIQIWAPDVRSAAFRAEAHRQSRAVARSSEASFDQGFIEALTDWPDA